MAKPNFNGQWIIDHTDGNTDQFLTATGTGKPNKVLLLCLIKW